MWAYYIVSIKVKRILKHISSFFSFIVSRAVHVEFVSNLSTTEFIKSFNKLISRRGKPKIIYSDNAKTCMAEAKWLDSINRDKQFHDFLSKEKIIWKFNVSRAPWWRWQYERLIGLTKQSLYKSLGKSLLTWSELEEVLLDIEVNLNNLPVAYIEKDLEYFLLTPNSMILGRYIKLPYDSPEEKEVSDSWKKQQRYVHKCKEASWRRWVHDYLVGFREKEA